MASELDVALVQVLYIRVVVTDGTNRLGDALMLDIMWLSLGDLSKWQWRGGGGGGGKETLLVWDERDYDDWLWHTMPKCHY